jgi:hypothetical protein
MTMNEDDIKLLVAQIRMTNQAWHLHQDVFGAQTEEARALRRAKDHLQLDLIQRCGPAATLVPDGTVSDAGEDYLLQVRVGQQELHACHLPQHVVDREGLHAFVAKSELHIGDAEASKSKPSQEGNHP